MLVALLPLSAFAELSNDSMIGPGLRTRPAYDGAGAQRTELVPVVRYFGPLAFVRSTQGVLEAGLRTELAPGLHAGAQIAYEPGRLASESAFLAAHAAADLRLSVGVLRAGTVAAGVFAQGTWANAKSIGSFYGITPAQSVAMGLPAYAPGAGWLFASVGLLGSVDLGPHWAVVGSAEVRHLRGDAAQGPLVQRDSNHYVNLGLAYRF